MMAKKQLSVALLAMCLVILGGLPNLACSSRRVSEIAPVEQAAVLEQSTTVGVSPRAVESPPSQDQTSTIRFERISTRDGLSQNGVLSIWQDRRGFMWFGTEDGLNKYDGYAFTVYTHDPDDPSTISDNLVSTIYEDQSGVMWVGTKGGLDRFDRATETFTHYQHNPDGAHEPGREVGGGPL